MSLPSPQALQKGQVLPSEPHFDSNCITPGTEFMAKLQQHLKYFVHKKLSTDPTWQQVEVILSGQDVSGVIASPLAQLIVKPCGLFQRVSSCIP